MTLVQPSPADLHGDGPVPGLDVMAAEAASAALLTALGVDLEADGMRRTAGRMAAAYAQLLTPVPFVATTFANTEDHHELVIARLVPFASVCAHHLLPFQGIAHVGYQPGERILGLSKLARVVGMAAARLQVQEEMTQQIAQWLQSWLDPAGAGVVIAAEHSCVTSRGVRATGSSTVTTAWRGVLQTDRAARAEFLSLAGPLTRSGATW